MADFRDMTSGDLEVSQPMRFETVRLRMPVWATDRMISGIISAITKWRYAHTNPTELVVWVPRSWLTERERAAGYGTGPSMILGVPLMYGPVTQVIVGVGVDSG